MAFPTVDLFTGVEPLGTSLMSHLNRLAIDTPRRGGRGSSLALALAVNEHGMDLLPNPLSSPAIEGAIDRTKVWTGLGVYPATIAWGRSLFGLLSSDEILSENTCRRFCQRR